MNGRVGTTVVIIAALLTGFGPAVAATEVTDLGGPQSSPFTLQQDQIDADEVRIDATIRPNGTAEWTLEFWVRLDDNESATAFEALQNDIRDDPENYTQTFADRMTETVATASDATGREMTADGFDVSTDRQSFARTYGVVRYTFRWHGFAAVDGGELQAGDAIEGIYLDDGTRLLIEWPDGYELTSVTPDPDEERDGAVIWRGGETDFIGEEPRVVVTTAGSGPTIAIVAGLAIAIIGIVVLGGWWYRNHASTTYQPAGGIENSDRNSDPSPATDSDTATAAITGDAASASGSPEMELLSNEEQVLRLLEDRDGRVKQQEVVEELGWTDAKTSKVISGMRKEGTVESFRLGRENVLSLPEGDGERTGDEEK
ncbi:DUF7345 domain-containing protein [Natrinema gelatinilyticum]|uniref:DUF7345 domain-containing protein n=1 Tax=Natrinema gelatinilyticum TaxID=2961571 RepID=UPI0020C3F3E9|nr:DUF4897 domain-containing protein [Natrinema gelatinilyticum]